MASPPCFEDLGKSASDLFEEGFDFSKVKLTLKTKTDPTTPEFDVNGTYDTESKKTSGIISLKSNYPEQAYTSRCTWGTNSGFTSESTFAPKSAEGLYLHLNSSFLPSTGFESAKVGACYKRKNFNIHGDVQGDLNGFLSLKPTLNGSTVFQYNGWYAGYQVGYNVSNAKLTANNLSLGYTGDDFDVNIKVADVSDCTTSVFHKLSNSLEAGISTSYSTQTNATELGVVGKYTWGSGTVFKAKINNRGQIGTSYTRNLRPDVKLNLSTLIDGKNFNAGGHKLGAAFTVDF